jgi:hypothetical protein
MNVAPALSICLTRNLYHHKVPVRSLSNCATRGPKKITGIVARTGMKMKTSWMNRRPVAIGSKIYRISVILIKRKARWNTDLSLLMLYACDRLSSSEVSRSDCSSVNSTSSSSSFTLRCIIGTLAAADHPISNCVCLCCRKNRREEDLARSRQGSQFPQKYRLPAVGLDGFEKARGRNAFLISRD